MRRSKKNRVDAKLPVTRKSPKNDGARVRGLEKRLAEALQREAQASRREAKALGKLQTRDRELVEALDQQTATADILRVISGSPTDIQPVLDAVAASAARVCGATDALIMRLEGDQMRRVAHFGPIPLVLPAIRPISTWSTAGGAILECRSIHVHDILVASDYPESAAGSADAGWRTTLSVPLVREGVAIGAITIRRTEVRPFTEKQIRLLETFADQAVIAIENVRLFTELEEKNRALTEALDQQTATSEILRVISSSPTDVQPVFDAIAANAARLCDAVNGLVIRFDGQLLHLAAQYNVDPERLAAVRQAYPRPPSRGALSGRAILTRDVVHVPDVSKDPEYTLPAATTIGYRSVLAVPMMHEGVPRGTILVAREVVAPFSDAHIALIQTFADQAVIAIENVRLFNETKDALERQKATSEILRVISSSPTDVQPVFDAIVRSASLLCNGHWAAAMKFDGQLVHLVAQHNTHPEAPDLGVIFPCPPSRRLPSARAIVDRRLVHIPDAQNDPDLSPEVARRARSFLVIPMLQTGVPIGAIVVARSTAGLFPPNHIDLLSTFADQAVVAVENVRLFTELQEKNRALTQAHAQITESLEQQTATSEILRVISQSPTDVQPVFDAIIASAVRLLEGYTCGLTRVTGNQLELVALTSIDAAADAPVRAAFPQSLQAAGAHPWAIRDRMPLNVADAHTDPRLAEGERVFAGIRGFRSWVVVPMLRDDVTIGSIGVTRREAGGFTADEIALLQTFADQAVIAIENVRLFKELEARNRDLTESLEQQTATAEILRVISSSPTDIQPVFDALARSAVRLCGAYDATLFRVDGGAFRVVAHHGPISFPMEGRFPLVRGYVNGRSILDRRPVHVTDLQAESEEFPEGSALARHLGQRTTLVVPLMREGEAMGTIQLRRVEASRFTDRQIELLQTFADQAVIAIENVRLFTELQEKNQALTNAHAQVSEALEQQTATSEVLKVISRSAFDLQPVLDTLIENAVRLCGADRGFIHRQDGEFYPVAASYGHTPEWLEVVKRIPIRLDRTSATGRAALERRVIHIPDVLADHEYRWAEDQMGQEQMHRTILSVPMLRDGAVIGVITIRRPYVQPFTDKQVELLKTFADQAVIAIENVRLFKELEARTDDLTRSVEQLTALGEVGRAVSSTLDLETVLSTIMSRAVQLSGLDGGVVFEYDDGAEEFVQRVATETGEALAEARRTTRIRKGEGVLGRTAITLEPVQVPDITLPGAYEGRLRASLIESGVRAILAVPMLREGQLIGCLGVTRNQPGNFPNETIELLRTFATQSALAIQNARLFHEIEDKSRQLETASQHKSEFLANMSHELRTPLNAIIGFSEVLGERLFGELNEKQDEYLKDIHASGQHLLSLINDILDLSKIEAGRMELELTDVYLAATLENALTLVRERAGRRGIGLHIAVDERLGQIKADERKIRQVVLNLLSNAIKFTPEGGRIEVQAKPVNDTVEVSVTDNGVGIAPEDQEAIFEEFRQVGTADKKVEGTGLGLALSRKFIELHGGRIWVKSQVRTGSTFTFSIPVRRG